MENSGLIVAAAGTVTCCCVSHHLCPCLAAAAALQVGIPVDHHLLHMVEKGGLLVAAVGTVAATLGEILAVRALMRREHDKTRQRVDAAAAAAVEALERAERHSAAAPAAAAAQEVVVGADATARTSAGDQAAAAAGVEQDGSCGWKWDEGAAGSNTLSPKLGGKGSDGAAALLDVAHTSDKKQH
jgi:hypothetical protein